MHFAIIATFLYTLREVYGKRISNQHFNQYALMLGMRLYGILAFIILAIYMDFNPAQLLNLSTTSTLIMIAAIISGLSGLTTVYYVLKQVELGKFAIIASTSPIVTIILSFFILGEQLSILTYIGICIVMLSVIITTYFEKYKNTSSENLTLGILIKLIIAYFLLALSNVLYKFVSHEVNPLEYSLVLYVINIVFFSSFLYFFDRQNLKRILKPNKDVIILGIVAALAMYFLLFAFQQSSPTIVNTILQLKVFLMIGFSYFHFKEKQHLKLRLYSAILSFIGVILILGI